VSERATPGEEEDDEQEDDSGLWRPFPVRRMVDPRFSRLEYAKQTYLTNCINASTPPVYAFLLQMDQCLDSNSVLRSLDLCEAGLNTHRLELIETTLAAVHNYSPNLDYDFQENLTQTLETLDLSNNWLAGKEPAAVIARMLNRVVELRLSNTRLGKAGATELAPALQRSDSLRALHLDSCVIGERIIDILKALGARPHGAMLTALTLDDNNLDGAQVVADLATLLAKSPELAEFSIADNPALGDKLLTRMAAAFGKSASSSSSSRSSLRAVNVGNCGASSAACEALLTWAKGNTQLRSLALRQNRLSSTSVRLLAEIIEMQTHRLTALDIRGCQLGAASMKKVRDRERERLYVKKIQKE
jgi:hypothetical protein